MSTLASNIESQPEALERSLQYQCDKGRTAIEEAASLIRSAKKVVIAGMGASLFAVIPLQYHLCSLGLDAIAIEAGELLHYLNGAWKDAVVLMVSRSGESVEIARLVERMKGSAPIIGVTNEPESKLSRSADVSLNLASLPDEIVAIQTYTCTLLTLHLLGNVVASSFEDAANEIRQLLPAFASHTQKTMASITDWDRFLQPNSPVYLLARGASFASAQEGALLFHEVAKSPAVAMPVASFRHGPVEVVDHNFRGIVFAPQDGTRELNLALARDLVRFGGKVRVIGSSLGEAYEDSFSDYPTVPATIAPLFEVVPLQVAALRLALLRGIEPGSFRFAPQVAIDEASFPELKISQ